MNSTNYVAAGTGADIVHGGTEGDWLWGDDIHADETPVAVHGDDYLDGGDGADPVVGGGKDVMADVVVAIENQWLSDEPTLTIATWNHDQMVMADSLADFALLSRRDGSPSAANSLSFRSAA